MIMEEFLKTYFKYYLQTLPKTRKLFFLKYVANIPLVLTAICKLVLRDVINKLIILMLL